MIRVAAYCRVSTDKEDQIHSLESQKRYFYEYINRREDWLLTHIYVDEGITGTSIKKRAGFKEMLYAAQRKEMDLIITKEISRFARNTLDSIYYSRILKELGIGILFLNDNINTLEADSELRLTILSSIAQEESRKTSERVKWGQKRSMERGVVFGRDLLGYEVRSGKLYIEKEGAKTVRLIFHKFVREKKGAYTIAKELREDNIPTALGQVRWHGAVVLRILQNEKYCGDLIQKKSYTPDFLEHKKKKNEGQEEFISLKNHHEPIISREIFETAQKELQIRGAVKGERRKYSNRYGLSGIIKCASCGSSFVVRTKKTRKGKTYRYWRCYRSVKEGKNHIDNTGMEIGCNNHTLPEEFLKDTIKKLFREMEFPRDSIIEDIKNKVVKNKAFSQEEKEIRQSEDKLKQYQKKKERLIELFVAEDISKEEFQNLKGKYEGKIKELEREAAEKERIKQENLKEVSEGEGEGAREEKTSLNSLEEFIENILWGREWNETFYHNILDSVLVCEDKKVEINFKYQGRKLTGYRN